MKRNIKFFAAALGLLAVQPAYAQQTEEQRVDSALAQAKKALSAGTMTSAKVSLRRASNCLFGRDSGYYAAGVKDPCNARSDLSMKASNEEKRQLIYSAVTSLYYAGNQTDLQRAKDSAEDAIAYLEQAKELDEALSEDDDEAEVE